MPPFRVQFYNPTGKQTGGLRKKDQETGDNGGQAPEHD